MDLDTIDRYLQQLDFLKERERLQHRIEQLENKLKNIQQDEPLRILKEIVNNIHDSEALPKEWQDSGLVEEVKNVIDRKAYFESFWRKQR